MSSGLFKASVLGFVVGVSSVSDVEAGTFWFPIAGHYPYSSNLVVTAVPDLDTGEEVIKTRLWQTGKKSNGCIHASSVYPCSGSFVGGGYSVWAYKKDGGGDWDFDGVLYNDEQGGTGHKWLWYDNHNGYDFTSTDAGPHSIHAVEDGSTCGYVEDYGQICIEHVLPGGTYRTWYTHMTNIPSALKANYGLGHSIYRWQYLGDMSNVAPTDVGVHLHFTTRKQVGGDWVVVDPYGHKPGWPSDTTDDPNNPYLWD